MTVVLKEDGTYSREMPLEELIKACRDKRLTFSLPEETERLTQLWSTSTGDQLAEHYTSKVNSPIKSFEQEKAEFDQYYDR